MLLEKENLLLGKIIGLINGLESDPNLSILEAQIRASLQAMKDMKELDTYIDLMTENKKKYLPNCITCQAPCGRSNDFYLNDISSEKYRNKKIDEFYAILNEKDVDFSTLVLSLQKLCW